MNLLLPFVTCELHKGKAKSVQEYIVNQNSPIQAFKATKDSNLN
jgi:hypothetical protein